MQSNGARAGIAAALIAVAVVGFIVLSGGDDKSSDATATTPVSAPPTPSTPSEPAGASGGAGAQAPAQDIPTIVVKDGKPVGGIQELTYNKGDKVKFRVKSDIAGEVHLHGYDLMKDVEAGGTVSFNFTADIDGIFEAELEERKEQIIELRVNP